MTKAKNPKETMPHGSGKASRAMSTPQALDPALASLFASSLGPVINVHRKAPDLPRLLNGATGSSVRQAPSGVSKTTDEISPRLPTEDHGSASQEAYEQEVVHLDRDEPTSRSLKRKRKLDEDDLEGRYMQRLGQEEAKEDVKRQGERKTKRTKKEDKIDLARPETPGSSLDGNESLAEAESNGPNTEIPQHESLAPSGGEVELEKASRTVFFANVSTEAIKSKTARRVLVDHLGSFLPSLVERDVAHKILSLRFRSTAFSSSGLPKKAAYAKKELMDSTTKSSNAYVVYTTQLAAKEAVNRLNGTVVLDRHLRADGVAHPAKIDHRRCVFVGNLSFVDDESVINAAQDEENNKKPRKGKEPADAEEGLWRQFSKAGAVESVRVIRDKTTRVGKGFAYVQFQDANAVEKALLYHEKKFPPMLPRILRVIRAKSIKASTLHNRKIQNTNRVSSRSALIHKPKHSAEAQSVTGRANKLFGRAGAARLKNAEHNGHPSQRKVEGISKTPETIVFEGYRASSNQKRATPKMGGSGKKQGKPRTRSSNRGAAFKASGGKRSKA